MPPFWYEWKIKNCKTGNFRVQEIFTIFANFRGFANISCREYVEAPLSKDSRNFPVANLPASRFREINLSRKFPVLQYVGAFSNV